jgi:lipoate-protein ligase A
VVLLAHLERGAGKLGRGTGERMSRTWRLLVEDGVGAAEGLALDEALMGRYARGEPERPPTLRLYSYRDHCALIGRYQNIDAEIDLAACRRTGTEVNRRLSGGGAIVMGSGQLGIAYFDRAETAARPRETIEELSAALATGLAELGITASFRGKNDLEVGGRKIAGLGLYVDQAGAMLFHASVLADLDVAFMLQVLRIPAAKLADRATASVTERLTTVSAETGVAHDATTLRPVIAAGFAAAFGIVLQPGTPEGPERALAQALEAARYRSESWLNERSAAGDAGGTALLKTPAGLARIYLSTHGDLIKSAMVVGDFNELPPCVVAMESELRWRRLDHDAIFAVVTGSGAADALGVEPELLAGAVIEAGRESRERSVALAFRASDPDSRPRPG